MSHVVFQIMMKVFCDLLLVGIGDKELASHLADFTASLLEMGKSTLWLIPHTIVLASRVSGLLLDTQSLKNHPAGHFGSNFSKCQFQA